MRLVRVRLKKVRTSVLDVGGGRVIVRKSVGYTSISKLLHGIDTEEDSRGYLNPLCLFASNMRIAAETETFIESITPAIGIMMF